MSGRANDMSGWVCDMSGRADDTYRQADGLVHRSHRLTNKQLSCGDGGEVDNRDRWAPLVQFDRVQTCGQSDGDGMGGRE